MRSIRAVAQAGAAGSGLQNAWLSHELGIPRPGDRLDWIALRFYINVCIAALPGVESRIWLQVCTALVSRQASELSRP